MTSTVRAMDQLRELQRRFLTGRMDGPDLEPETLILDCDKIMTHTTHACDSEQDYILSTDVINSPNSSHDSSVILHRSSPISYEPPRPLFALNHTPADTDREYSLTAAEGVATLGNIDLASPPDFNRALARAPMYALLKDSHHIVESPSSSPPPPFSSSALTPRPDLLFTLVMSSWTHTTEYYTHNVDGKLRFLASEDVVNGKPYLIIADTTNQKVRDALVGVWCLRLWREALQAAKQARRRARKRMRRLAMSRKGMSGKPDGRRPRRGGVREMAPVRLNKFERLKFGGRGPELHGDPRKGTKVGRSESLPECTLWKLKGTDDTFEEVEW